MKCNLSCLSWETQADWSWVCMINQNIWCAPDGQMQKNISSGENVNKKLGSMGHSDKFGD